MSETRWLDEREERAWRALKVMQDRLNAALARELAADSPLSYPDYEVLVALTDQPEGKLRPFELGELLGWEQSRLSHHVGRMLSRGLVKKIPCSTDRRGAYVAVTPKGHRSIEAAAPGHVAAVRRLFIDHVSSEQLDVIADAAEQVLAALAKSAGAAPETSGTGDELGATSRPQTAMRAASSIERQTARTASAPRHAAPRRALMSSRRGPTHPRRSRSSDG